MMKLIYFLRNQFQRKSLSKVVKHLHKGKAVGPNHVTAEHFVHTGKILIHILVILFNAVSDLEYIAACCRVRVLVPLQYGKLFTTTDVLGAIVSMLRKAFILLRIRTARPRTWLIEISGLAQIMSLKDVCMILWAFRCLWIKILKASNWQIYDINGRLGFMSCSLC